MILIDPITREEILLAKALGENVPDIVPVIRKEMYLAKIAGADIQTPEAITREEMYLDAIANGTEVTIEPITRKEMFYAKALGLIENAPEPITRIESLLNQIAAGGGGGGFDKYSWEGVFASIDAGTYATDYAIGDTIPLDLGSEGLINMQIVAFDTDDLADGSGKAPITWIAKELLTTSHALHSNGNVRVNWDETDMYKYLRDTIKPLVPQAVRERIVAVTKTSGEDGNNENITTTELWIPSDREVIYAVAALNPKYVPIYAKSSGATIKNKHNEEASSSWWLRDQTAYYQSRVIKADGGGGATIATNERGVCLGFCT